MEINKPIQEVEEQPKETEQTNQPSNTDDQSTQQKPDDLLQRVSKFQVDNDSKNKSDDEIDSEVFNDADLRAKLDSIDDPDLKQQFVSLRKSLMSGYGKKSQEFAELRKEIEAVKNSASPKSDEWTPERVQSLLNDQKFIEAAQTVTSVQQDEYSNLSESEKSEIIAMKNKVAELEAANQQALQTQQMQIIAQQHADMSNKYANYDTDEISQIALDMRENKIQATTEHIYKAFKHDENVRNAYEMGLKEGRSGVQNKIESISVGGVNTTHSDEKTLPEKGESTAQFIKRIVDKNFLKSQK